MVPEELIPARVFCQYHNIEYSFIDSIQNSGLILLERIDQEVYIRAEDMAKLEKYVRLHYDLDINFEGIETIEYLLHKMEELQMELMRLKSD